MAWTRTADALGTSFHAPRRRQPSGVILHGMRYLDKPALLSEHALFILRAVQDKH